MISLNCFSRADIVKIMAMVCFCGWMPVYAISLVMVWANQSTSSMAATASQPQWSRQIREIKKMTVYLTQAWVFLEDIPQLIIQSINNTQNDNWSTIQIISIVFPSQPQHFKCLSQCSARTEQANISRDIVLILKLVCFFQFWISKAGSSKGIRFQWGRAVGMGIYELVG